MELQRAPCSWQEAARPDGPAGRPGAHLPATRDLLPCCAAAGVACRGRAAGRGRAARAAAPSLRSSCPPRVPPPARALVQAFARLPGGAELLELVKHLLHPDPRQRWTMAQVAANPAMARAAAAAAAAVAQPAAAAAVVIQPAAAAAAVAQPAAAAAA